MSWRGGWVVSLLVVGAGCGGALPGEEATAASSGEVEAALDSSYCLPTEADTQRVKVIFPPSEFGSGLFAAGPGPFEDFRGTLFFGANFEDGRRALWKSDGTEAGTVQVKSLPSSTGLFWPIVTGLKATPSRLFFLAGDAAHGTELWASDGTGAGTQFVKDLTPGPESSSLSHLTAVDDALVFFKEIYDDTTPRTRYELWRSDGTSSGTVRLRDFGTEMDVSYLDAKVDGALLFFVRELSGSGTSLWKTDGTTQGTVRLKKLTSGADAFIRSVKTSDSRTLFILGESTGLQELWKSDGTASGTVRLASFGSTRTVELLGSLGSWAYVTTTSNTTQYMVIYRVPLAGGNPTSVVSLPNEFASQGVAFPFIDAVSKAPGGSKLFFTVHIGTEGPGLRDTQLWVTDGTAAGTTLLRKPLSLSDEYSSPLRAVSDDLVFFSSLELGGVGVEPWVSNGTPGGTRRLRNIATGATSSYPYLFLKVGSRVFFGAYDETLAGQLWSTALSNSCMSPDAAR